MGNRATLERVTNWPRYLRWLTDTEQGWSARRPDAQGDGSLPWMPYPMPGFIMYLADAVRAAPGNRFLDVGCGPGTKCLLARELFTLDVEGVEIDSDLATEAKELGVKVSLADAMTWNRYGDFDIVYVNPCVLGVAMQPLMERIMTQMRPGAILMQVNGASKPSRQGWLIVAEEYDSYDGVWQKPPA